MNVKKAIILLAVYIFVCTAVQNSLVLCVRADGTTRLTSTDHWHQSCCHDLHEHSASEQTEITFDGSSSIPHDHCCDDYPIPVLPQLVAEKDCATSAQKDAQTPMPATVHVSMALDNVILSAVGCEAQAPSHIKTFILLI